MMHSRQRRHGFVLLAVLWVLTGAASLGLLLMLTSRDAQGTAANRVGLTRARWRAEGCIERARAAVDDAVGESVISDSAWIHLDALANASSSLDCTLRISPVGMTLDVNAASAEQLHRLWVAAGVSVPCADSMTAAILDWRDADDDAREDGAEREWYEREGHVPPRNGDIESLDELGAVRGMSARKDIVSLLGVEPGRILLSRAPPAVLAALPGMSSAVLSAISQRRAVGDSTLDAGRLAADLPAAAREQFIASLPELMSLATALPDAWVIAAESSDGHSAAKARVEVRVVRSGRRLAILRRRSDP